MGVSTDALAAWVLEGLRKLHPSTTDERRLQLLDEQFQRAGGTPKAEALVWADVLFRFKRAGHRLEQLGSAFDSVRPWREREVASPPPAPPRHGASDCAAPQGASPHRERAVESAPLGVP
jgi:hypothetical protein